MSQATLLDPRQFLARKSFIELNARERAQALMDQGTFRELLGPFDRLESPWLPMQGVVPQADDGLIVARGRIGGKDSVILAIEGKFQGGSAGEVSGAKMTATLDLAHEDAKRGRPVQVVLLLETGGVRLQEANLGFGSHCRNQLVTCRPTATCSGHRRHCGNGRLLRRNVHHRLALQLSDNDPRGEAGA